MKKTLGPKRDLRRKGTPGEKREWQFYATGEKERKISMRGKNISLEDASM